MSPRQLLKRLEKLGVIEDSYLDRIRREIDKKKNVKPKAILAYLVKKEQITQSQANRLLKEADKPKPIKHEEIEVTVQAEKDAYDTDDLTQNIAEAVTAKAAEPEVEARKADEDAVEKADYDRPTESIELAEKNRSRDEEIAIVQPDYVEEKVDLGRQEMIDEALADPLADPSAYGDYESKPERMSASFSGKIDKSDQWQTKWLYIAFGILGSLLIIGAVLRLAVYSVSAEDRFKAAMVSFEAGTYQDSIQKFDEFLESHPNHEKANVAKVRRVQALLASTYNTKNWKETIVRAENHLPPLIEDDDSGIDLGPIRDDLAVMLPKSTLEIALGAVKQPSIETMEKELEFAQRANKLVNTPAYIPGSTIKNNPTVAKLVESINNNIATAEDLIQKEKDYDIAIVQIEGFVDKGQTEEAFSRYHRLIRQYGDLAARERLRDVMKSVSHKERSLVQPTEAAIAVGNSDRASNIESTIVLASKNGRPVAALSGEIVPVLADGSVYGIDAGDGSVIWRRFVGYQTRIQPQAFDAETLLVSDQMRNDLSRLKLRTGELTWRAEIGEPFAEPAFDETRIVVTTASGKVLKMDPSTGEVLAAAQLPQSANASARIAERDPYIYQPGYYSNIYVLSADDLSCKDVYYMGHYKGAIEIAPQHWSGYMLVAVNGTESCDLHVLRATENGLNLELVQLMRRITTGPVSTPLQRFGRWMLLASDNGEMKILELDPSDDQNPIRQLAGEKFDNQSGQAAHLLTEGSQLWIGGNSIVRYKIQRALGQFSREVILNHGDYFYGPPKKFGDVLIHARRRSGSAMVSVAAVDAQSLKEIWRTDLGGVLASAPIPTDEQLQVVSSQGDLFQIGREQLRGGYVDSTGKASTIDQVLMFDHSIALTPDSLVAVGPRGRSDFLFVQTSTGESRLLRMPQPVDQPACRPIRLGTDLIIASRRGPVLRVDPKTGRAVGTPFQPPVQPNVPIDWKRPVVLSADLFVIADGEGVFYVIDGSNRQSLSKVSELAINQPIKSPMVANGNVVLAVTGTERGDQLQSFEVGARMTSKAAVELPAGYEAGPWVVGDNVLVLMNNDELACFGSDLTQKWSVRMENDRFAGPPVMRDTEIMLVLSSGRLSLLDPATGDASTTVDLGQPISHGPLSVGNKLYFGGADGTVHVVDSAKLN